MKHSRVKHELVKKILTNKFIFAGLLSLSIIFSLAFFTLAGDIPESIMHDSKSTLLIGKIEKIDKSTITISPKNTLMGSIYLEPFKVDRFKGYYGTSDKPKENDYIVIHILKTGKLDTTWLFKASSTDYKSLKLISEKYNMVARYEKYINEGKYQEAQKNFTINASNDITPKNVYKETSAKIYKNAKTCEAYILYKNELYSMGMGFGGYGVTDIKLSDFNKDGKKEILYSYSWGSGLHRSVLAYFDFKTLKSMTIKKEDGNSFLCQNDLTYKKISDFEFEVYISKISVQNGDFTKLTISPKEIYGKIVYNKIPVLILQKVNN